MGQQSLSVVVPVYNSAEILPHLIQRLEPVLAARADEYEVILVDDSSSDGSWEVVRSLARERSWLRGVRMVRNYGQHNAILCGVREARMEIVVTVDDDLQHPPEEIPKLLDVLDEGCDVVYGTPQKEQHGLFRDLATRVTKLALQSAMGAETARKVSAFRVFRRELSKAFADYRSQFVSIDVLLTWGTSRFAAIPVRHDPRTMGESNYTFKKLVTHALNMATGFSTFPLQIASVTGFAFVLVGAGVLVFVVGRFLFFTPPGESVPGFAFLASVIALFSGAQLFALGIMGEYLARMHFRMMERPPFAIRSTTEGAVGPD